MNPQALQSATVIGKANKASIPLLQLILAQNGGVAGVRGEESEARELGDFIRSSFHRLGRLPFPQEIRAAVGERAVLEVAEEDGPYLSTMGGLPPPSLNRCLDACVQGGKGWGRFCESIPNPKLRAKCRGLYHVGEIACRNWCFWHYKKE